MCTNPPSGEQFITLANHVADLADKLVSTQQHLLDTVKGLQTLTAEFRIAQNVLHALREDHDRLASQFDIHLHPLGDGSKTGCPEPPEDE